MKHDNFNSLEHNKNDKIEDNVLTSFIKELQNVLNKFIKNSSPTISETLSEESIYIVRDINDEKLCLVNSDNGKEVDIFVTSSKDKIEELHHKGIFNNVYEMSAEDLYSLNLGSNVTIKGNSCILYNGDIQIKSPEAAEKLEDMYFCLEQEKNAEYLVSKVSEEKIYLTNTTEGGYFSISKKAYPDFKVGDLVKNINGKYILI